MKSFVINLPSLTITSSQPYHLMAAQIDYSQEFRLTSVKYMFRVEDITPEEAKLWMYHLADEGFKINEPHEIFIDFLKDYDNRTDELRVRYWTWKCGGDQGKEYKLVDMNSWPGDNESGIISIDGIPLIGNGDAQLNIRDDGICPEFQDRLQFFETLRISLGENVPEDRLNIPGIKVFRESELGQQAMRLNDMAWEKYRNEKIVVEEEQKRLQGLYLHEFTFMCKKKEGVYRGLLCGKEGEGREGEGREDDKVVIICPGDVAIKLGYKLKDGPMYCDNTDITYTFIKWTHQVDRQIHGKEYVLVRIKENEDTSYILDDNGKIVVEIFKSVILNEEEKKNEIIVALQPRMYAYFAIKDEVKPRPWVWKP